MYYSTKQNQQKNKNLIFKCRVLRHFGSTCSVYYPTIISLGRVERAKRKEEIRDTFPTVWQQAGLQYLDDKMTASAGTKSLPFILKTSPTSTCEKKLVTGVHGLWNSINGNMSSTSGVKTLLGKKKNINAVSRVWHWWEDTLKEQLESSFHYCWTLHGRFNHSAYSIIQQHQKKKKYICQHFFIRKTSSSSCLHKATYLISFWCRK